MTATTIGIDLHIQELRQVATDLRNERTLGSPASSPVDRIRLALGNALVQVGTSLAPSQRRTSAQVR